MKMFKLTVIIGLLSTVLFSCSIHNRHFYRGYKVGSGEKKQTVEYKFNGNKALDFEFDVDASANVTGLDSGLTFNSKLNLRDTAKTKGCDVIVLKNGDQIFGKVVETSGEFIKYKRCSDVNSSTTISYPKADVARIKYANGKEEVIKEKTSSPEIHEGNVLGRIISRESDQTEPNVGNVKSKSNQGQRVSVLGNVGFALSIAGIILAPLALVSAILCILALNEINKSPEEYENKKRAKIGLIISGIVLAVVLIVILVAVL